MVLHQLVARLLTLRSSNSKKSTVRFTLKAKTWNVSNAF